MTSTDPAVTAQRRATAMVTAPQDPVARPAWALRDAVAAGELGAVEVVAAHLERLKEVQPALNAAITVLDESALRAAEHLQDALSAGEPAGVLCAVPFSAKDILATARVRTTCGSGAFAENVPVADAVAIMRMRAAGAVLIAKSNTPEFAFGVTTQNPAFGPTRNPWGLHSPGGSSGGEAVLVSSGASAVGLGTDFGGSLRWPAQCCGILALRPTAGRVDGTGQLPEAGGWMDGHPGPALGEPSAQQRLQTVGPLARTVRDLAVVTAVIADDPALLAFAAEPTRAAATFAIGWLTSESSQIVDGAVQQAVADAAAALGQFGFPLRHTPTVLDGLHHAFNAVRATDPLLELRAALGDHVDLVGEHARQIVLGAPASPADPAPLWAELERLRAGVLNQLAETPVLLAPVAPSVGCDMDATAIVDGVVLRDFELMAQCRAVSALGLPSLSILVGQVDGLPVSVQVIAGPGREDLVLRVGLVLEQLLGGHQQPPWLQSPATHRDKD